MEHSQKLALSREISSKIRNGIPEWDVYQQGSQRQAWELSNLLAHSLAGGEIVFLAGHVHSQETGEVELAAYTLELLVHYRGIPGTKGAAFKVLPRRTLSRLEVHSAPPVLTVPSMGYHSMGSYELTYGESVSFPLPLAPRDRGDDLEEFAPSLWQDLLK